MSTAIELRRRGIEVELVEIAEVWRPLGSGITMMAPALRALHRLGLLDRCLEHGFGVTELRVCDKRGERLATIPLPRLLGPDYPGLLGMMRPTLHDDLTGAVAEEGIPVQLGTTVTALEQGDDGVRVALSDGTEREVDLVVGADGFRSSIRELVVGTVAPVFREQAVYRAVVARPEEVDAGYQFRGDPLVHPGFTPISQERMYVFLPVPATAGREPCPRGSAAAHARAHGALRGDRRAGAGDDRRPRPDRLPAAGDPAARRALASRPGRARGGRRHTTTPHMASGAAIAMEDAIVLGEELAATDSVDDALQAFVERRWERCRLVVETSAQLSTWQAHPGTPGADPDGLMGSTMAAVAQPF